MTEDDARIKDYLSRPYSRILIPQEEGGFSAEILEFSGCFAEGETVKEAFANLEEAAGSWILACLASGRSVPAPLTNYQGSGRFALRLPPDLYQRAAKIAAFDGVSLNTFIATALAEKLGARVASDPVRLAVVKFVEYIQEATTTVTEPDAAPVVALAQSATEGTMH